MVCMVVRAKIPDQRSSLPVPCESGSKSRGSAVEGKCIRQRGILDLVTHGGGHIDCLHNGPQRVNFERWTFFLVCLRTGVPRGKQEQSGKTKDRKTSVSEALRLVHALNLEAAWKTRKRHAAPTLWWHASAYFGRQI